MSPFEMKLNSQVLEIDKCVDSRLWYSTWVTLSKEINTIREDYTRDEILQLISVVQADTYSRSNYENRWIIWKILDLLGAGGVSARPDEIEFSMALKFVADEVPVEVEQELMGLFEKVTESKSVREKVPKLSNESIEFLEKSFEKSTALACSIVKNLLCVWSPLFQDSDVALLDLYINGLKKYLNVDEIGIKKLTNTISELETSLPLSLDNHKLGYRSAGISLSILSKLELTEDKNDQLMTWLFPALFIKCDSNDVELAFYTRKSSVNLMEWRTFIDKILRRFELADNLENAFAISNAIFNFSNSTDVRVNSRELVHRTIKQRRHWLLDILDSCDVLLASGYPEKVSVLLSARILNSIWPTVLFKVVSNFLRASKDFFYGDKRVSLNLCNGLRFVLNKCRLNFESDESWNKLNLAVENQLDVVEWVLKNKKISNNEFGCDSEKDLTIKHVFSLLLGHGVLSTLNSTTTLHEGSSSEIEKLLRNSPGSTTTFRAYRSMLCALRAILLCKFHSKAPTIEEYLKQMKKTLKGLFPLEVRLEAMENIFSMIFLRHEDFSNADSNSEEGSEGETEANKSPETDYKRIKSGFICNKYIIRDLLHYLRKAIFDAGIESTEVKLESRSSDAVENVQKRLANLGRAIADATWKLELLTSFEFVGKIGHHGSDASDNREEINLSEISLANKLSASKLLANKPIFYQQEESSSSDEYSKSEVDLSSDPGSMDNTSSGTGLRKKQWKKNVVEKPSTFNSNNSYILNLMLSSRESLTIQCLWKSDFEKAQQVIEMFRLNDSQLDGEVRFSKAICQYRQRIRNNTEIVNPTETINRNSEISTLQNIRQAVQEGIQTSRLTGQLETFLASNKAILHLINPDEARTNELLTMAVLDLALTTGHSRSCSLNALEVATKYLKSCKMIEKTMYSAYFLKICRIFYESKLDASLPNILCDVNIPLSINKFNEKAEFWNEVDTVVRILNESRLEKGKSKNPSGPEELIMSKERLTSIAALCNGEAYLNKICTHLNILETMSKKNPDGNFDRTPHGMLEQSIHSYFGHQFFELGVDLAELDDIAKKLGVNLVHSILVSCCPKFDFHDKVERVRATNERRYIVLNENSTDSIETDYDMEKPNECVAGILTLLLDGIRKAYPTKSVLSYDDVENLSKNSDIQDILRTTCCLKNLNLCELSAGSETLTFFLNLWNLLFLHSLLTVWSIDAPCNRVQHVISAMTIGYKIGDLGSVTLAILRSKLLGNLAWDLELFKYIEDVNEIAWQDLDLEQDPRVIFAMGSEFFGTPAVCVYDSRNLEEALNTAMHNYIAHYHSIDSATDETKIDVCWLPEPVRRYQDFLLGNTSLSCQNFGSYFDESFILRKFLNVGENNLEFKYRPQLHQYEIRLNYSQDSCPTAKRIDATRRGSNNFVVSKRPIRMVDGNLIHYFKGHCWLLSYLVQKIHEKSLTMTAKAYDKPGRCVCLENLLRSPWTETLRTTFKENQTLLGMHENVSPKELWMYFENFIKKEKWKLCLYVINCLPDNLTKYSEMMDCLKDKVLNALLSSHDLESNEIMKCVRQIMNIHVLASTILSNLKRWPIEACESALTHVLNHSEKNELPLNCKMQLSATLCKVSAFRKMLPYFANNTDTQHLTWYAIAYPTNKTDLLKIIKSMIDANKFELCFEWLKYHTISVDMQSLVTENLLLGLLENDRQDFEPPAKLLQALPVNFSTKLCNDVINNLQSISAIKFVTNYLLDSCEPGEAVKYHKILMSVEILSQLERRERLAFIHLLKEPLLMLEQLLMNGKFETLQKILNTVSVSLPKACISFEDIDKVVRYYATKSLEFRVALQRDGIESRSKDSASLNTEAERTEFLMPLKVPTKDEWVPNDKSRVCSCCKSVVFSMFNRRHHCRRCGRVVCAVCSQQRMRVQTYPDSVLVRVCEDCKRQTSLRMQQQQQGVSSTPSSETFDYWRLTTDETHNETVRDEFSFEHAPSISLCLAILNLHSDHKAYASFLLDRCDEIRQLLRPVGSGRANPEVDHELLVKMIRSLLIAAKVKCAKLSLNAGLDHCDRFLSHMDLVATLIRSDCTVLIPSDCLEEHALPRLRHLLTEKEQWILALDVSTKSGLDRQGVWAAWGKAYLKVGCYEQAREKFAHCLDKVSMDSFEDWVLLPNSSPTLKNDETSGIAEKNEKQRAREKTRPTRNPPLLMEILQILESSTFNRHPYRSAKSKSVIAHDISVTLNNIKSISQGRYYDLEPASGTDNAYYNESLHYLLSYGSHSAILEFFVRHEKYEECLLHMLENRVDPETFFQSVYLLCLKNGCVDKLHEAMRAKDTNLFSWKSYLVFTCHTLETRKLLNTLYQLQIFTKDYVRAAISCIRFYGNGATDYTDLCSRSKFLHQAQKHLETELQAQSFSPKRRKSTGSQHSGQSTLTLELELSDIDRHINTISRQMEIAKFLRNSEQEGRIPKKYLNDLSSMENENLNDQELPTLFGTQLQKTQLAVLAILCGRDVEEGFGIAFRIIQDYNLRSEKVYSLAGHILASEDKISSVEQLVKCCRSSGAPDTNALSDRVLAHCVKLLIKSIQVEPSSCSKEKIDSLIKLITDLELKISMCIESRQLKAAYLLAVRHSRAQDVRKIFNEADRLEQHAIKAICAKWLAKMQKS